MLRIGVYEHVLSFPNFDLISVSWSINVVAEDCTERRETSCIVEYPISLADSEGRTGVKGDMSQAKSSFVSRMLVDSLGNVVLAGIGVSRSTGMFVRQLVVRVV